MGPREVIPQRYTSSKLLKWWLVGQEEDGTKENDYIDKTNKKHPNNQEVTKL